MPKLEFRKLAEEKREAEKRAAETAKMEAEVAEFADKIVGAAADPPPKAEMPATVAEQKAPEPAPVAPATVAAPEPVVEAPAPSEGEVEVTEIPVLPTKETTEAPVDPPQSKIVAITDVPKDCPFILPTKQKRLKVLLWGPSGAGKTCLALQFPAPAVIDTERGTKPYEDRYQFRVLPTTSADEMMDAIDWMHANRHPFRTLVVDPITTYWEALQAKWSDIFLMRNQGGRGFKHEFYDMQIRDWNVVKSEYKEFIRKLLALDMNVIVTAHSRVLYSEGETMKKVGETYDAEKKTEYAFDVILRLHVNAALDLSDPNRHVAQVQKDRFGLLPQGKFPTSYSHFARAFGEEVMAREATPFEAATPEQVKEITASCTELGLNYGKMMARLRSYGSDSFEELSKTVADTILAKLRVSLAAARK